MVSRLKGDSPLRLFDGDFTPQARVDELPLVVQLSSGLGPNTLTAWLPFYLLDVLRWRKSRDFDADAKELLTHPGGLLVLMGTDTGQILGSLVQEETSEALLRAAATATMAEFRDLDGRCINGYFGDAAPLHLTANTARSLLTRRGLRLSSDGYYKWQSHESWVWTIERVLQGNPPTDEELIDFHGGVPPDLRPFYTSPNTYFPRVRAWEAEQAEAASGA